jgi:hypothetical protein
MILPALRIDMFMKNTRELACSSAATPYTHPQYGTEHDYKIILVKLCAQIFCFDNAPILAPDFRNVLETRYLGHEIEPGSYKDKLLLEGFDFNDLVNEGPSKVGFFCADQEL